MQPQTFIDRLAQTFGPTDFVRILNIDSEAYEWDYCADETVVQPDQMTRRVESRQISHYKVDAGKSTKMPGAVAYVMMDGLFKKVVQKEEARASMMQQPEIQEKYIEKMFLGIENDFLTPDGDATPSKEEPKTEVREEKVEEFAGLTKEKSSDQGGNTRTATKANNR